MKKRIGLLLLLLVGFFSSSSAQTIVKGVVRDASSNTVLQSVSVYFKGGKGVSTNADGSYTLTSVNPKSNTVQFSYVGYKTAGKAITPGIEQVIDVLLEVSDTKSNVTVKANKRSKYSNRNNPAVELIKQVIDNKNKNRITAYDYTEYEQYEKMELSLTNKPEKLTNNKLLRNFQFILDNQDSSKIEGKSLLPVYIQEKLSQKYYRKDPEKTKTYLLGDKQVNFGDYVDNNGIRTYLNRLYEDVDIYQNNISLLTNQFLSPIADMAPTFYRFYITDTTELDG
ncbi:MAG TPA: carboxypeptidase-like regulatory domain-containing protein, partial [Segetibacter sp.]